MKTACRLTVFEGVDGSGKTTAARAMAEATDAAYVHLGPFPDVGPSLARLYAEAMAPAVAGYRDVIMDRSWVSESIYGTVYRDGVDRVEAWRRRHLERLALRCAAVVVVMRPPWQHVESSYLARRGTEMLVDTDQLRAVTAGYDAEVADWDIRHDLPCIEWDYTAGGTADDLAVLADFARSVAHPVNAPSAGRLHAPVLLVGSDDDATSWDDTLMRWPYGSLSDGGTSHALTQSLRTMGVRERDLCWVSLDASDACLTSFANRRWRTFALGHEASRRLIGLGVSHHAVGDPRAYAFTTHDFTLPTLLKDLLS